MPRREIADRKTTGSATANVRQPHPVLNTGIPPTLIRRNGIGSAADRSVRFAAPSFESRRARTAEYRGSQKLVEYHAVRSKHLKRSTNRFSPHAKVTTYEFEERVIGFELATLRLAISLADPCANAFGDRNGDPPRSRASPNPANANLRLNACPLSWTGYPSG